MKGVKTRIIALHRSTGMESVLVDILVMKDPHIEVRVCVSAFGCVSACMCVG